MNTFFSLLLTAAICLTACSTPNSIPLTGSIQLSQNDVAHLVSVELIALNTNSIQSLELGSNLDFSAQLTPNEIYLLRANAPFHEAYEALLWHTGQPSISSAIVLSPMKVAKEPKPMIIGNFNGFNIPNAIPMRRTESGNYQAEVNVPRGELQYQFVGVTEDFRPVPGNSFDRLQRTPRGEYISILTPETQKVTLTFSPDDYSDESNPSSTISLNSTPLTNANSVYQQMIDRQADYVKAVVALYLSGKPTEEFRYDWSTEVKELEAAWHKEENPQTRSLIALSLMDLALNGASMNDPEIFKKTIKEIQPLSSLWSLNAYYPIIALRESGSPTRYQNFLKSAAFDHPNPEIQSTMSYYGLTLAYEDNLTEEASEFYTHLQTEFAQTELAEMARMNFNPKRTIAIGKPVPDFSIASLSSKGETYTRESFKGQFVLLDFWATWCGPCLQEMDELHAAFEEVKDENITFLSLSFDETPKEVIDFRKNRHPMPWKHSFVEGGFESRLARNFEVSGIPKPILVNPEGIIVAEGPSLRGPNLIKTLKSALNQP